MTAQPLTAGEPCTVNWAIDVCEICIRILLHLNLFLAIVRTDFAIADSAARSLRFLVVPAGSGLGFLFVGTPLPVPFARATRNGISWNRLVKHLRTVVLRVLRLKSYPSRCHRCYPTLTPSALAMASVAHHHKTNDSPASDAQSRSYICIPAIPVPVDVSKM